VICRDVLDSCAFAVERLLGGVEKSCGSPTTAIKNCRLPPRDPPRHIEKRSEGRSDIGGKDVPSSMYEKRCSKFLSPFWGEGAPGRRGDGLIKKSRPVFRTVGPVSLQKEDRSGLSGVHAGARSGEGGGGERGQRGGQQRGEGKKKKQERSPRLSMSKRDPSLTFAVNGKKGKKS